MIFKDKNSIKKLLNSFKMYLKDIFNTKNNKLIFRKIKIQFNV